MSFQRYQQFLQHVFELLSPEQLLTAYGSVTVMFPFLRMACNSKALIKRTILLPVFLLIWHFLIWEQVCRQLIIFYQTSWSLPGVYRTVNRRSRWILWLGNLPTVIFLRILPFQIGKWYFWERWTEGQLGSSFSPELFRSLFNRRGKTGDRYSRCCSLVSKLLVLLFVCLFFSSQNIQKSNYFEPPLLVIGLIGLTILDTIFRLQNK